MLKNPTVSASLRLFYKLYLLFKGPRFKHLRHYFPDYQCIAIDNRLEASVNNHKAAVTNLSALAHKFSGNCNIICSGPSTNDIADRDQLLQTPSIAMNGSHHFYEGDRAIFEAYIVVDIGFIRRQWPSFVKGLHKSKRLIVDHRALKEILLKDASILKHIETYVFQLSTRPFNSPLDLGDKVTETGYCRHGDFIFSTDADRGLAPSKTVAYLALQVAALLGFKHIKFYGLDMGNQRFYKELSKEPSFLDNDYDVIERDFKSAIEHCHEQGVRVYNANPKSRLPQHIFSQV